MRKTVATLMAVGALMLSGGIAYAENQPPPPPPGPNLYTPKCLTWDGQYWNNLPCGWTTDGKRWIPLPPPPANP
jgi:hypothetical protein